MAAEANVSEPEKNRQSKVVKGDMIQQSAFNENIAKGKKSVAVKEVSPSPVSTDTKSSSAKRKKTSKKVQESNTSGPNISEAEKNEQSKVVKEEEEEDTKQFGSGSIAKGKKSIPVKKVSPPVTTDKKSTSAKRKKQPKETIQDCSNENVTNTVPDVEMSTTVAQDTNIMVSEKTDGSKVVKKECLQPSFSDNVGKEQNKVAIKHNVVRKLK